MLFTWHPWSSSSSLFLSFSLKGWLLFHGLVSKCLGRRATAFLSLIPIMVLDHAGGWLECTWFVTETGASVSLLGFVDSPQRLIWKPVACPYPPRRTPSPALSLVCSQPPIASRKADGAFPWKELRADGPVMAGCFPLTSPHAFPCFRHLF